MRLRCKIDKSIIAMCGVPTDAVTFVLLFLLRNVTPPLPPPLPHSNTVPAGLPRARPAPVPQLLRRGVPAPRSRPIPLSRALCGCAPITPRELGEMVASSSAEIAGWGVPLLVV